MGLTGTTLLLVSLAFLGSAAALQFARTERDPPRRKKEKAATFTAGTVTPVDGTNFFFRDGETCFYNNGDRGSCQNGECHLNTNSGVPTHNDDYTPSPTEKPKTKKEEYRRRLRKPKATKSKKRLSMGSLDSKKSQKLNQGLNKS
uniref:Secreted protein n=1 Tax=Ixodes ricinus TaxID=34613 RepID=V5IJ80_IXORI